MSGTADPKPTRRVKRRGGRFRFSDERIDGLVWREGMGGCQVCPAEGRRCDGPTDAHHVISQQKLKRLGRVDLLHDHRNRLSVCRSRHSLHESASFRISRAALPLAAFAFAAELDLMWWLEERYPDRGVSPSDA